MIKIDRLEKQLKKQLELYNVKSDGVCFPVALYNAFPKIFNNDEEKIKKECEIFDSLDYNTKQCVDYFNKYIKDNGFENESLFLRKLKSFDEYIDVINLYKNNLLVMVVIPIEKVSKTGHAVAYLGIDDKTVAYFENGKTNIIIDYCIEGIKSRIVNKEKPILYYEDKEFLENKGEISLKEFSEYLKNKYIKIYENFSTIDCRLLYESIKRLYFIGLDNPNSYFKNFSSRLDMLNVPNNEIIKDSPINKIDDSIMITSDMLG